MVVKRLLVTCMPPLFNNFFRSEQFLFRWEHSTTLQLVQVVTHLSGAVYKNESTVAVILVISKAVYRIWHKASSSILPILSFFRTMFIFSDLLPKSRCFLSQSPWIVNYAIWGGLWVITLAALVRATRNSLCFDSDVFLPLPTNYLNHPQSRSKNLGLFLKALP